MWPCIGNTHTYRQTNTLFYIYTSREPGDARGNYGFPELIGTLPVALRAILGPLREPAQPFGLILHKMATLNCVSGNPESKLSPCGQFEARFAGPLSPLG